MEDFISFTKSVGVPSALLLAVLFGLYRLAAQAIRVIGVPVAQKHCQYLDKSIQVMDRICDKLDAGVCRAPETPGASACTPPSRESFRPGLVHGT